MGKITITMRNTSVALAFSFVTAVASAQVASTVNNAANLVKSGTDAIGRVGSTMKKIREGRSQFDSTVKIVRDNVQSGRDLAKDLTPPKFKNGKFSNFKWKPVAQFDGQIFTSTVLSMKSYDGKSGDDLLRTINGSALGFRFRADKAGIPVRWEIESVDKSYFDKVSGNFTIPQEKQEYYFMPTIPWNTQLLASLTDSTPIRIVYRIFDAAGNKEEHAQRLTLRAADDCILSYEQKPLDFLYTAFIQEKHPEAVKIAKDAAKIKFTNKVPGYQAADLATLLRVCALWKTLHDRGLRYKGQGAMTVDEENDIISQRVQPFGNAIQKAGGSSVDGMIVLATALKAMGIAATLELTHDRCFVGFYTSGKQGKNLVYLDPAMLANSDKIEAAGAAKDKNAAYLAQFMSAVESARKAHAQYAVDNDLREIDVNYYRAFVQPLPFN